MQNPWIQRANCIFVEKISAYKWTCRVQIHAVQKSTVHSSTLLQCVQKCSVCLLSCENRFLSYILFCNFLILAIYHEHLSKWIQRSASFGKAAQYFAGQIYHSTAGKHSFWCQKPPCTQLFTHGHSQGNYLEVDGWLAIDPDCTCQFQLPFLKSSLFSTSLHHMTQRTCSCFLKLFPLLGLLPLPG